MVIFGWRSRTSVEETGSFDCPICNAHQPHVIARMRPWFTLFFIPVFPVARGSTSLVCGGCQSIIDPNHLSPDSDQVVMARQVYPTSPQDPYSAAPLARPVASFNPHKPYQPSGTTGWSIASLIFGILSPIFLVACFLSIITSLVAIVTGHVALSNIKHSRGRLHGRGLAITGLVFGYLMLPLTVAAIVYLVNLDRSGPAGPNYAETQSGTSSSKERLNHAEMMVASNGRDKIAFGNSEAAEAIATGFADSMKVISEQAFTRSRKPVFELSGGNFLTYCELHDDSCALVVHVPSYRKYEDDAKESLSRLAWALAQSQTSGYLKEGDQLAVALRGTLLYGDIMLGTHSTDDAGEANYRLGKSDDLLEFFPVETATVQSFEESEDDPFGLPLGSANKPDPFADSGDTSSPAAGVDHTILETAEGKQFEIIDSAVFDQPVRSAPSGTDVGPSDTGIPNNSAQRLPEVSPSGGDSKPDRPIEQDTRSVFENKIPTTLIASLDVKGWNIQSLAFINNNRHLAAGRLDGIVEVFDIESHEKLYKSDRIDPLGQVIALESSRDGQALLLGGYSGATAVMQINPSGSLSELAILYKHDHEASCLVASPAYDFVLSGGRGGTLAWQPFNGRSDRLRILQELDKQVLAAHLPVKGSVAMASDGRKLLKFSLQNGNVIEQYDLHRGSPQAVAFHPHGTHVVVSYGSEVLEFETEKATLKQTYKVPEIGIQWSLAVHPDQPWLFSGGQGVVHVWDRETAQRLAVLDSDVGLYIQTLELAQDGSYLAMVPAAAGQSIKVFAFED